MGETHVPSGCRVLVEKHQPPRRDRPCTSLEDTPRPPTGGILDPSEATGGSVASPAPGSSSPGGVDQESCEDEGRAGAALRIIIQADVNSKCRLYIGVEHT